MNMEVHYMFRLLTISSLPYPRQCAGYSSKSRLWTWVSFVWTACQVHKCANSGISNYGPIRAWSSRTCFSSVLLYLPFI